MQKIFNILSFLVLLPAYLLCQTSIDYFPKSLQVELQKAVAGKADVKHIELSAELERTLHQGRFYQIENPIAFSLVKYIYVGRVNTCRAGGCSLEHTYSEASKGDANAASEEESEYFDYFIFFDAKATVQLVKIHNYQASHGEEVTSKSWLNQFKNYDGSKELVVGKNVDAISGATISVDATAFDIELRTTMLMSIIQQLNLASHKM
ncbi:MAG: hypothetical protein AUK44_07650 [Porphyromonadaceae bacterium CG2_30_38_12]|nr:MAG: hypothetical protein AUK44_07650 [Porphyromonadaceae bacterium CG2_30_38_12]